MKIEKLKYIILLVVAFTMIFVGSFLAGKWSGILIGIGAGTVGLSIAQLIGIVVIEKNPKLKQQASIAEKDERSVQLNHMAKARAFTFNQILALPLFLFLIIADVKLYVLLIIIGANVLVWFSYMWSLNSLLKEY